MDIKNQFEMNVGDMLVAPPNMKDPRFNKSVILLTRANDHRSQGFVLNKRTNHGVNHLIDDTGLTLDQNYPLYWGGPVSPNTVWMLHDAGWGLEQTIPINDEWSMTSHRNMFEALKIGHTPSRFRILYGFAGWGSDQLENEIRGEYPWTQNSSWLILHNPDPNWIVDRDADDLWTDAITFTANQTVSTWL